jgi:hypothetical protein
LQHLHHCSVSTITASPSVQQHDHQRISTLLEHSHTIRTW